MNLADSNSEVWMMSESHSQPRDTVERVEVRADRDSLVPLHHGADDDWGLHIRDSSYILTFSTVTQIDGNGLHCLSDGEPVTFVAEEDTFVPEEIVEKLREIAAATPDLPINPDSERDAE